MQNGYPFRIKNHIIALVLLTLAISSCQKENTTPVVKIVDNNGCIEWQKIRVTDHSGYAINDSTIRIIDKLFASNKIDRSQYRYVYYSNDSTQTYFPPYAKSDDKLVRVKEFANGLEIFTGELGFLFKNNVFQYRSGNPSSGTRLDTSPNLAAGQLRAMFLADIEQFDRAGRQYKDSCFRAEFGYYNINAGTSNPTENLVKAWKVTVKNRTHLYVYPIAYYQDKNGALIYYDNGIRSFR